MWRFFVSEGQTQHTFKSVRALIPAMLVLSLWALLHNKAVEAALKLSANFH